MPKIMATPSELAEDLLPKEEKAPRHLPPAPGYTGSMSYVREASQCDGLR